MGTRNLEVVVLNGEFRVAQYCQWDGYISGQGKDTLTFLRDKMIKDVFIEKIKESSFITDYELKKMWISCGASPDSDMVSIDVSDKFSSLYPHLHRNCGSKVFEIIQNSNSIKLQNNIEFAGDSLFCEWCYVVDLDKNTFEVYKGFNQSPLIENDRFYFLQKTDSEYYPVKMIKSYSLENLPSNKDFIDDFKTNDDDE